MNVGLITQLTTEKAPLPNRITSVFLVGLITQLTTEKAPLPNRITSVFLDGCVSFRSGVKVGDNPYHETDERHWEWMGGWAKAGMDACCQAAKSGTVNGMVVKS